MIGTWSSRGARDHLDAVDPGQAEVEDDEIGMVARGQRERDLAGRGEVDLVAARLEVRAEGAQELRLVVDDQDRASSSPP